MSDGGIDLFFFFFSWTGGGLLLCCYSAADSGGGWSASHASLACFVFTFAFGGFSSHFWYSLLVIVSSSLKFFCCKREGLCVY